jgi:uncharacterized membrane protein YgdD (TMEM256/DUF423 family)
MNNSKWFAVASLLAALGIALGAFGAHGLPRLQVSLGQDLTTMAERQELFETAVRYHIYGALALAAMALAASRWPAGRWRLALGATLAGTAIFCGVIYGLVVAEGPLRAVLGATAPVGGSLMIAGWAAAAWTAWRVEQ